MACEEGGYAVPPNLVDGEFWLPSDFLSDEATPLPKNSGFDHGRIPYEWGLGSVGFQVDSPGESPPAGLSETDEEDDYIAGLAERVAYAMLDDDENCQQGVDVGVGVHAAMNWASSKQRVYVDSGNEKYQMSRSPQSTLSGGLGRSRCSPTEGSRLASNAAGEDAWELFHMPADQVVRLNMLVPENSDRYKPPVKGFSIAPGGGEPQFQWSQNVTEFQNGSSVFTGFDSGYNASQHGQQRPWNPRPRAEDRKIPAHQNHQYPQAKQSMARQGRLQAIQAQQGQNRCGHTKPAGRIYSACPPGQQIAGGSGMRAVFLGSNGPGRESGGTGVFLPRRMDNGHAVKQKPACSTVLLPARIVQALNLNVEDLRSKPCGLSEASLNRRVYTRVTEHQKAARMCKIIVSNHNFESTPSVEELRHLVERLQSTGADIVKFTTTATNITDVARVFQVFAHSQVPIIASVISSRGLISSILCPKFGGYLTFGSLGPGKESSSGHPALTDLINIYRINNLGKDTKVFGIIGNPVGHSKGPILHNRAFREIGLDAVYVPFLVDDLAEFLRVYSSPDFSGFSVTIPHKEAAVQCCDEVEPIAQSIGAVNTVVRRPSDGKLIGYNTDYTGAISAIEDGLKGRLSSGDWGKTSPLSGRLFVVVGAGGAGKALAYGAKEKGARVVIANRNYERAKALANLVGGEAIPLDKLDSFCRENGMILANTTSVGMHPNVMETPISKEGKL